MAMKKQGLIYVVRSGNYCKIGFTADNPHKRIEAMQTGNPVPIELLGAIAGTMDLESELHLHFASKHVSGEWFLLDETDVDYIFSLRPAPGIVVTEVTSPPVDFGEAERVLEERIAKLDKFFKSLSPAQQRYFLQEVKKIRKAS